MLLVQSSIAFLFFIAATSGTQNNILTSQQHSVTSLVQISNPPGHPPASPDYSHISIASAGTKLVNIAGQVGIDDKTGKVESTFQGQVRKALENMDLCLEYAKVSKKNIVSTKQYVVGLGKLNPEDSKARLDLIVQWLNGTVAPPGALLGVEALATSVLLFEFEVTAVVH